MSIYATLKMDDLEAPGMVSDMCMALMVKGRCPKGEVNFIKINVPFNSDPIGCDTPCSPEYRAAFEAEVERLFPK